MSTAVLLRVREMLKEGSEDSGEEQGVPAVYSAVIASLEPSLYKAISLFNVLCTKYSSSPQEHATQVEMRVSIAHIHYSLSTKMA